MLLLLSKATTLISLLLFIPAIISAFLIFKEYNIRNIRFAKYFKLLLLQGFIHSIFLVLAIFYLDFKTAFLIHSFAMIPLYGLLAFRLYHLKYVRQARLEAQKIQIPKRAVSPQQFDPRRIKALRLVGHKRSNWH